MGLELHDGAGQLLGQTVVDLVGDLLAMVIACLQEVFQCATSFYGGLVDWSGDGDVRCERENLVGVLGGSAVGVFSWVQCSPDGFYLSKAIFREDSCLSIRVERAGVTAFCRRGGR